MKAAQRLAEKQQAEADKDMEEESEVVVASAELSEGERKVISDGTEGPVVEIIKRSAAEPIASDTAVDAVAAEKEAANRKY